MITKIPAKRRHFADSEWLQTYWLFSFGDYYDPKNIHHGALRVFNDDTVAPGNGFPEHPHSNYEIVTIVFDGELTHKDSAGHQGVIKRGDVQRMSAGSGIFHSEFNYGTTPVHLYQIWIEPIKENLTPSYEQKHFDLDTTKNQLVKLLSPEGKECLAINSDSMLYFGSFDPDKHYTYTTGPNRKVFIYLSEGEMRINHELFSAKDQARIDGESELELQMIESSKFILIDTPA